MIANTMATTALGRQFPQLLAKRKAMRTIGVNHNAIATMNHHPRWSGIESERRASPPTMRLWMPNRQQAPSVSRTSRPTIPGLSSEPCLTNVGSGFDSMICIRVNQESGGRRSATRSNHYDKPRSKNSHRVFDQHTAATLQRIGEPKSSEAEETVRKTLSRTRRTRSSSSHLREVLSEYQGFFAGGSFRSESTTFSIASIFTLAEPAPTCRITPAASITKMVG